ncbi:PH domain-containing protein [Streptomyces sp. NPDC005784]|uniref:PH domain-containing protein n=1 Tax=Streptomyces sp. NPDC005784 TaxID=3364731 RepID=UPI0036A8DB22
MGAQELPREYRAGKRKTTPTLITMVCMTALLLIPTWTIAFPLWLKLLVTVAVPLFVAAVAAVLPRTGTVVDRTGIRIQGPLRTHQLAWADIQDIRTERLPAEAEGKDWMPNVISYVYLSDGRRKLLIHVNDLHTDLDREIGVLRSAWSELRDRPVPLS